MFFDNYAQYEYHLAQIQLILFMVGMGATLTVDAFVRIVQQPRHLGIGAACQFLITPFFAVLAAAVFDVEDGIAVGLIMVAAMPGGTLSKLFTYLGKGNIALSITLTALGTLATLVTVPVLLQLLAADFIPEQFEMPVLEIIRDLLLYLLMPLGVGMVICRIWPDHRIRISRWCIRVGFVAVLVMVVGSLGSGRIRPGEYGWTAPLAIIFFCVLSQQVSMLPFRLLGWSKPDCLSIGIEVTMRNLNLALLLKALLFPAGERGIDPIADGVLFVILFYAPVALGAGFPLAMNFRRMIRKEERLRETAIIETSDSARGGSAEV